MMLKTRIYLVFLGIMMAIPHGSQALSFPRLPNNDSKLEQYRDGFLNDYGRDQQSQTINVSELRDVSPKQWAYEALRGLVERYGCIAGHPDRVFRGKFSLPRHEFAAGLNACLNSIEQLSQENVAILREDIEIMKRLAREFEGELVALGARTSNLESRTAYLENNQVSTTALLSGEIIVGLTGIPTGEKNEGTEDIPKVINLGYRGRLKFNSTFDGDDSLYIRLTTGTAPAYSEITETFEGGISFSHPDDSNLAVQLIIYDFALAENVRMFIEPVGGAFDDFVPTVNFLDGDASSGAVSAFGTRNPLYYMPGGPGIGFRGRAFDNKLEWSGGYLADKGANPGLGSGMFNGPYGVMGQLAYEPSDNFKVAFTYLHGHNNLDSRTGSSRSNFHNFIEKEFEEFGASVDTINNSYRMEFRWHVSDKFVLGAWGGFTTTRTLGAIDLGENLDPIARGKLDIWNWAATLAFPDLLVEGDTAGIIIGMEPWVAKSNIVLPNGIRNNDRDSSIHIEAIYERPVNDHISITPGITVICNPDFSNRNRTLTIGTLRTTFTF